ncbi:sterol desaturase family protein [Pelagibacterales bacterium]|jgi:sterol desaturase/sphingolipid hydroxylase (fatty acid hydroxylase superfamily)|nr:sterol desaturase family protein [Pelagibacterales bacterium]MBL6861415.1 sterol desaturase family protein [Pelagibacterales bacterium]MDB9955593.1 sterol desaturase family protein [Pelagibacterales bacterium]|tara:strand:- start:300 stop:1130 length:831 start_codon:yes stop_codon:yes gene_type:complete
MNDLEIYSYGVPIVLGLILAEVIYSSSKNLGYYSLKDSLAGYGLLVGNILINFLTKGSVLFFYIYLYQFKLVAINDLLSPVYVWVLTFITIDFIFYWYHRCSHRVRFLWAVHMNHHSSEEMNFSVSLRQAWFGPLTKIPFFMFMPLLGFDPIITAAAGIILTLWGVLGHTQWINRLGPLEYIFVTPSAHRVHHGSNEEYLDKNYGNFLIIWDRLFGTFADEKSKVVYGIVDNVKTFNPLKITFQFWITMYQDYKNAKSLKDKILCFVGRPEWKPDK